ncbi:hypothetical protein [Lacipirellula sp.]|uniref:hypothetical protein n=1 Tax=Lacipirellula sp. TaxID=2691419 RepID=UPI003D0E3402
MIRAIIPGEAAETSHVPAGAVPNAHPSAPFVATPSLPQAATVPHVATPSIDSMQQQLANLGLNQHQLGGGVPSGTFFQDVFEVARDAMMEKVRAAPRQFDDQFGPTTDDRRSDEATKRRSDEATKRGSEGASQCGHRRRARVHRSGQGR